MKLSILLANYNRDWYLDRSIPLIGKQMFPADDFELVIVDDGSNDKSDEVIRHHKANETVKRMTYLRRRTPRKDYGNCAVARNLGATASTGDCLLFTDPEVMPLLDWAQKHYLANCAVLDPGLSGKARLKTPDGSTDLMPTDNRYVIGHAMLFRLETVIKGVNLGKVLGDAFNDYDWKDIEKTYAALSARMRAIPEITDEQIEKEFFIYQFSQGGVSISRKLFFTIGGFEEAFSNRELGLDMWAGEDVWFMHCATCHGATVVEEPTARAIHIHHPVNHYGCKQCDVAHKMVKAWPAGAKSNVGRSWGVPDRNGFEVVF